MNRDNILFTMIGLLAGFIGGYMMHEVMAARQPQPNRAGAARVETPAAAPTGGAPTAGRQPAMEQVQQLAAHVRENPDDAQAIRLLANLNYDISNWQRAAELYSRYLQLESNDFDIMTDLGATYRHLGKPQEALEQFRNVRALAPDHWQSRYNEILVLAFDLNDLTAASAAMDELISIQPDNQEVARLATELKKRMQGA